MYVVHAVHHLGNTLFDVYAEPKFRLCVAGPAPTAIVKPPPTIRPNE